MKKGSTKEMEKSNEKEKCYEALEELVRVRVQEFIQSILEEEVEEFLGRRRYERRSSVDGNSGYRNGYGKVRRFSMKTGTIKVRRPRVRNTDERFESRILPLFKRRTKEVGDLLPELYLHGLSKGDFELALRGLLGEGAPLSASSIQRLKAKWEAEYREWKEEDLSKLEVVYMWADGIYVKAGLEREKAALLVVVIALKDGTKKIVAVESGFRESKESWCRVMRDLNRRGLKPPKLVIADGNLGIWAALAEVYPDVKEQRCWNHKIMNVLDNFPRKIQPSAREYLLRIANAESLAECERWKRKFKEVFGKDYPRACETLERDWDRMVTFYEFPREHWRHIRTTNVVESPLASVRLRTYVARRFKKVKNATALVWKVLMVAEKRFRKLNAPHLLEDVYNGVRFVNGRKAKDKRANEVPAA
jgi:transposase-like protein